MTDAAPQQPVDPAAQQPSDFSSLFAQSVQQHSQQPAPQTTQPVVPQPTPQGTGTGPYAQPSATVGAGQSADGVPATPQATPQSTPVTTPATPAQPATPTQPEQSAQADTTDAAPQESGSSQAGDLAGVLAELGFTDVNPGEESTRLREAFDSLRSAASERDSLQKAFLQQQDQINKLMDMTGQGQQSQLGQQSDQVEDSSVPRFKEEWSQYIDDDGVVSSTAPLEVQREYQKLMNHRQRQVRDPEGWFLDYIKSVAHRPEFQELLQNAVSPVVQNKLQETTQMSTIENMVTEMQGDIFQLDPVNRSVVVDPFSGTPQYNDVGRQIAGQAAREMKFYGLDPNDPKNEAKLIQSMHRHYKSYKSQAPAQQPVQQVPQTTQQPAAQRAQNQQELINRNSFQSMQDPGVQQGNPNSQTDYGVQGESGQTTQVDYNQMFRDAVTSIQ